MCACLRDPQPSTIQDFYSETEEYQHPNHKNVIINNCSALHYTVLIQLGEEGIHMNNFTFKNFVSLKLILEGELKENVSINIENFSGVFGNILGQVEIKGVVRCFDTHFGESQQRKSLNINISKVDAVMISNFFIKDVDNSCDINFNTKGSSRFMVKESRLQKNISGTIISDNCIRNSINVPCADVFIEYQQVNYTIKIVMGVIGIFALISLSVIISRVPS